MFSEWTDPNDIDQYTSDIDGLMKDIATYSSYKTVTPKHVTFDSSSVPEPPVGVVVNTPEKNSFEVRPDTIAADGHPVGHQPSYNILYSAPPTKHERETFSNNEKDSSCITRDHILMILVFVIVIFGILLVQARASINQYENTIRLLFINMQNDKRR